MAVTVRYSLFALPPNGTPSQAFRPLEDQGKPYDFEWNEEAGSFRDFAEENTGSFARASRHFFLPKSLRDHTFELRRIVDENWRAREQARFDSGDYKSLPMEWSDLAIPTDHFCHLALNGSSTEYVAYTESAEKGQRDIQTRTRAGKYLTKFFPNLSGDEVRRLAEAVQFRDDLSMTDDPDVAATVYENGPDSCMKSKEWFWKKRSVKPIDRMPRHPVAAYFAGDLKLAWLGPQTAATARTIVWPEKKLYGRIYGAADRLRVALERKGYKPTWGVVANPFEGARLREIRINPSQIVMPFVDGAECLEYVYATKTIHIGRSHATKKGGSQTFPHGGTGGAAPLADPSKVICCLTGRVMEIDDPKVVYYELMDNHHRAHLDEVVARDMKMTEEGVYSLNPLTFVDSSGVATLHSRHANCPAGYVQDAFSRETFAARNSCVKIDNVHYTLKSNKDRLVYVGRKYYSSLDRYYRITGDTRRIVSYGPYSPKQWKHATKAMKGFIDSNSLRCTVEHFIRFYNGHAEHFHAEAVRKYPQTEGTRN